MEYKEIKRKNGERTVFCRIEDLIKEFYHVDSIDEASKHKTANGEYIIHCPFCKAEGHTKHKLYIKEDLSVGHCFVCTRAFINVDNEIKTEITVPKSFEKLNGHQEFHPVFLNDPIWSLDRFYDEFDDDSEVGTQYLIKRHGFMKELKSALGFKFLDDNVVMPFFYHGQVFYYQIRFTGTSKIRYFFPPIEKKPPYIIERNDNKKFIIQEGVYDAIANMIMAPEYTPMSVLGSSISDYQIEFLKEYAPREIVVYMDETKISVRIAEKLKSAGMFCPVYIIRSGGEDPEERMKRILKRGGNLQWITSDKFKEKFIYGNSLG